MQKEKIISGMNGHIVLSPMERERIIQRREPSGSGYWANVKVSFSRTHCALTIPVTFDITRVEGGM